MTLNYFLFLQKDIVYDYEGLEYMPFDEVVLHSWNSSLIKIKIKKGKVTVSSLGKSKDKRGPSL